MTRYDEFGDTIPTDHAPLEGEPRKPLYTPVHVPDESKPGKGLLVAVLLVAVCAVLVAVCAVLVILAVPVAR